MAQVDLDQWVLCFLKINCYAKEELISGGRYIDKPGLVLNERIAKSIIDFKFGLGFLIAFHSGYLDKLPPLDIPGCEYIFSKEILVKNASRKLRRFAREDFARYKIGEDKFVVLCLGASLEPFDMKRNYPVEYETYVDKEIEQLKGYCDYNREADTFLRRHDIRAYPICVTQYLSEMLEIIYSVYGYLGNKNTLPLYSDSTELLSLIESIMVISTGMELKKGDTPKEATLGKGYIDRLNTIRDKIWVLKNRHKRVVRKADLKSALHMFLCRLLEDIITLLAKKKALLICRNSFCGRLSNFRSNKSFCSAKCRKRVGGRAKYEKVKSERSVVHTYQKTLDSFPKEYLKTQKYLDEHPQYIQYSKPVDRSKSVLANNFWDGVSSSERELLSSFYLGNLSCAEIGNTRHKTRQAIQKALTRAEKRARPGTMDTLRTIRKQFKRHQ